MVGDGVGFPVSVGSGSVGSSVGSGSVGSGSVGPGSGLSPALIVFLIITSKGVLILSK